VARAIWKGVIRIGSLEVPVKLYSAVEDRAVRFRLLHEKDKAPVQQQMVNPETGEVVPHDQIRKAYPLGRDQLVILEADELAALEPEPSRDVEITRFVEPEQIDHRWYERAYYLGPDGDDGAYFAAAAALAKKKKEGVARWVMRKKAYIGALREENGYLMLIVLRNADEVISAASLSPPSGRALEKRELAMAEQLVSALEEPFDPSQFEDLYRTRVMELVETKARGGKVKVAKFKPRRSEGDDLAKALEASLAGMGKRSSGRG
jgi:DNA end-binding protein Ku